MKSQNKNFYKNLKNLLNSTTDWPSEYIYKFIYQSNPEDLDTLKKIFKNLNADFKIKKSKNHKYMSVSVRINAKNPDIIIEKYVEVANQIENVILL